MAAYEKEAAQRGHTPTLAEIVQQLGWHPDHIVPPCPGSKPPPSKDAFRPTLKPCRTRRTEIFREMVTKEITPTAPERAPTGEYIWVAGFCRRPGACLPYDTFGRLVDPTADANELIAQISSAYFVFWFLMNDPLRAEKMAALEAKWRSTGVLP